MDNVSPPPLPFYFYKLACKLTFSYEYPTSGLYFFLTFVWHQLSLKKRKLFKTYSSIQKIKRQKQFVQIFFWNFFLLQLIQPALPTSHPIKSFEENFSYSSTDLLFGPLVWRGECARGRRQSPIDIRYTEFGTSWGSGFTEDSFNQEYYNPSKGFYSMNDGHTFEVQFNNDKDNPTSKLILSGAGFHKEYTFAQLHFHWGDRDEVGSEHTLHGQRYPMEIHLTHYKSKYGNLSNALSENHKDREAVAVLAVLCQLGDENHALKPIVSAASSPSAFAPSTVLKYNDQSINVLKLLPRQLDFVRYFGSLTSPPCSEKVAWTIFLSAISISRSQLDVFRNVRNRRLQKYYNYRPLQPRNGRKLKHYRVLYDGGELGPGRHQDENTESFSPLKIINEKLNSVHSLISNILNMKFVII